MEKNSAMDQQNPIEEGGEIVLTGHTNQSDIDGPLSSNADLIHQRDLVDSSVIDLQHFAYYFLLGSCILRKKKHETLS